MRLYPHVDPLWTALVKLDAINPEGAEFGYICVRAPTKEQAELRASLLKHPSVRILEVTKDTDQ